MNKYRNQRIEINGIKFASKAEGKRYVELSLLEKANEIEGLKLQPRYPIHVNGQLVCTYVADFEYWDKAKNRTITEDVKGMETDVFKLKRKLFKATNHRDITIVRAA